jgi:hypothetical protein
MLMIRCQNGNSFLMEKLGYGTWREYPNSSNCYIGLDADRHRDCFVDREMKARLYIMITILETRIKGNSITIQNMVERVLKLMPFACSLIISNTQGVSYKLFWISLHIMVAESPCSIYRYFCRYKYNHEIESDQT